MKDLYFYCLTFFVALNKIVYLLRENKDSNDQFIWGVFLLIFSDINLHQLWRKILEFFEFSGFLVSDLGSFHTKGIALEKVEGLYMGLIQYENPKIKIILFRWEPDDVIRISFWCWAFLTPSVHTKIQRDHSFRNYRFRGTSKESLRAKFS